MTLEDTREEILPKILPISSNFFQYQSSEGIFQTNLPNESSEILFIKYATNVTRPCK
jgi:hypothetical protein